MTSSLQATDAELTAAIEEEVGWLPGLVAGRVKVDVEQGAVTLTGQVDTLSQRRAAVAAAFRVRGVVTVADEVVVHHDDLDGPSAAEESRLAEAVAEALALTVPAAPYRVTADVHGRTVTLSGTVAWDFQRTSVVLAVEGVAGVADVEDRLVVGP